MEMFLIYHHQNKHGSLPWRPQRATASSLHNQHNAEVSGYTNRFLIIMRSPINLWTSTWGAHWATDLILMVQLNSHSLQDLQLNINHFHPEQFHSSFHNLYNRIDNTVVGAIRHEERSWGCETRELWKRCVSDTCFCTSTSWLVSDVMCQEGFRVPQTSYAHMKCIQQCAPE